MNCYCTGKGNPVLKQYIPESLGSCVCVNTYKPIYVFACTLGAPSGPKKTIIQSVIMITGISLHIQTHSENYELGFLPIFEKPLYLNPFVGEMEKETQSHFWFQSSTFEAFTCLIPIVSHRLIACTIHIVNLTDVLKMAC